MTRPFVSVITNSYNSGTYLRSNIESIVQQSYFDWEHIVIDCGSTDNSIDILSQVAHRRLRVFQVPFCGVADGRNIGIAKAKGDIIAILDSDDYALPERLSKQVNILVSMPDIVGVGSGIIRIDEATNGRRKFIYSANPEQIPILLQAGFNPIPHSSLTFRLSSFKAVGGYSKTIEKCEDFELLLRLAGSGPLLSLPIPLVQCMHRQGSHTRKHRPKGRDEFFYTVLSLILNSSGAMSVGLSQEIVETWLDAVGPDGVRALLGRWSLGAIWQNYLKLNFNSLEYLMKQVVSRVSNITRCREKEWWAYSKTPRDIAVFLLS